MEVVAVKVDAVEVAVVNDELYNTFVNIIIEKMIAILESRDYRISASIILQNMCSDNVV